MAGAAPFLRRILLLAFPSRFALLSQAFRNAIRTLSAAVCLFDCSVKIRTPHCQQQRVAAVRVDFTRD